MSWGSGIRVRVYRVWRVVGMTPAGGLGLDGPRNEFRLGFLI